MIEQIQAAAHFVGPVFWALIPLSIAVLAALLLIIGARLGFCPAPPGSLSVFLSWVQEGAVMIGLTGNMIALSGLGEGGGCENFELASRKIFTLLSIGFRGSIIGVVVSLVASIGLLILKRR